MPDKSYQLGVGEQGPARRGCGSVLVMNVVRDLARCISTGAPFRRCEVQEHWLNTRRRTRLDAQALEYLSDCRYTGPPNERRDERFQNRWMHETARLKRDPRDVPPKLIMRLILVCVTRNTSRFGSVGQFPRVSNTMEKESNREWREMFVWGKDGARELWGGEAGPL